MHFGCSVFAQRELEILSQISGSWKKYEINQ